MSIVVNKYKYVERVLVTTTRSLVINDVTLVYETTAQWNFVRMTWHYSMKCLPVKFLLEPEVNHFLANERDKT